MNEFEWVRAFLWSVCFFGALYALEFYILDGKFDIWAITLIPMGKEILWMGYKYFHVLWKGKKKAFVRLKGVRFQPMDFIWIVTAVGFVAYVRQDMLQYVVPVAILNLFFIYVIKKNQQYYFGEWDIENLAAWDKNIDVMDIKYIEIEPTFLSVYYGREKDYQHLKGDERKELIIKKDELITPQNWYDFQKMVEHFKAEWQEKKDFAEQKTANLQSDHESVS
jgi:hypothetical protein